MARLHVRDTLLVGISTALITISILPRQDDRRLISVVDSQGVPTEYSVKAKGQQIREIEQLIDQWGIKEPVSKIAIHRWKSEAAQHYQQLKEDDRRQQALRGAVIQVSYTDGLSNESESEFEYWISQRNQAIQTIQEIETHYKELQLKSGTPPVQIGRIIPGNRSPQSIPIALIVSVLAVASFMAWKNACPANEPSEGYWLVNSDSVKPGRAQLGNGETLKFESVELPHSWIKIHQPLSVHLQSLAVFGLVILATFATFFH